MAESFRTKQLRGLADKLPVANQQVASGLKSAQDIQLKQQVGQATGPIGIGQQQALGTQQTQQRGAIDLQTRGQTAQQLGQVSQLGLQEKGLQQSTQLGQEERQLSAKQRDFQSRLSNLDNSLKDDMLDRQLEFKKDNRGQLLLNDRQLADMAALNAKSEEEFKSYMQATAQATDRKISILEQAYKVMEQTKTNNFNTKETRLSNEQVLNLKARQAVIAKQIAKEKALKKKNSSMAVGVGTVVGGIVGAYFGNAGGAVAGATAGGALGGVVYDATSGKE